LLIPSARVAAVAIPAPRDHPTPARGRASGSNCGGPKRTRSLQSAVVATRGPAAGGGSGGPEGHKCHRRDRGGQEEQTPEAGSSVGSVLTLEGAPGSASSRSEPTGGRMSRNPTGRRAPPHSAWSFDSHTSFCCEPREVTCGAESVRYLSGFSGGVSDDTVRSRVRLSRTPARRWPPTYQPRCDGPFTSRFRRQIGSRSGCAVVAARSPRLPRCRPADVRWY